MDIRTATRFGAIVALLVGAWFVVKMLKPREAELTGFDSNNAQFGDMSSAADKRAATAQADDPTSGLDMVPSSSLPIAAREEPPPPPPAQAAAAPAAPVPDPEPAPPPAPPARRARPRPAFQRVESANEGQAATTSAFMAAPEDAKQEADKKKK